MVKEFIFNLNVDRSSFIATLIKEYKYKNIAEIGVSRGDNARRILENLTIDTYKIEKFYLIDLPEYMKEERYKFVPRGLVKPFNNICVYITAPSLLAADLFKEEELDLVFLDADHSENAFNKDINAWLPKIRRGGILAGDEYLAPNGHSCAYRTELLNNRFYNLNYTKEQRLSEGKQTYLWWILK